MEPSKTKLSELDVSALLGKDITCGSLTYYLSSDDVLYSSGSFGQLG